MNPLKYPPAHPVNPIIQLVLGSWYESQVFDFNVLVDGVDPTILRMYATGMEAPVLIGNEKIGLFTANSSDPYTWTNQGPVLTENPSGWENDGGTGSLHGLRIGSAFFDSGTYYLYYSADLNNGGGSIGVATSTDGVTFTKYVGNPILTPAGQGYDDVYKVECAFVIKEESSWTMIYSSIDNTHVPIALRYATSSDGLTWTKGLTDVLTIDPSVFLPTTFPGWHQVHKINGTYYIIYEAGSGTVDWNIAIAESSIVTGPYHNTRIFFSPSKIVGRFDRFHVATPALFNSESGWIMYYCGAEDHEFPVFDNHWPGGATGLIERDALTTKSSSSYRTGLVTYKVIGPSGGFIGDPSTDFTAFLPTNIDPPSGTVIVTPHDSSDGSFTPTTVSLTHGTPIDTFTYTPASIGAKVISFTNDSGLINPSSINYSSIYETHFLTGLVSYWTMDESGGTRFDSHGSNDLSDNNTVESATGKIGNAASFIAVNSTYLSHVSNASLQMSGNTDWTISTWVNLDPSVPNQCLITKDDSAPSSRDYTLDYHGSIVLDGGFRVYIQGGATYIAIMGVNSLAPGWYFLVAWYDSSNGQLHLRVNDATTYDSITGATGTDVSNSEFRIGARQYTGAEFYSGSIIDESGLWKRLLTTTERTQLFNGGAGLPYSSFTL